MLAQRSAYGYVGCLSDGSGQVESYYVRKFSERE